MASSGLVLATGGNHVVLRYEDMRQALAQAVNVIADAPARTFGIVELFDA